jgi:hypothetical protein
LPQRLPPLPRPACHPSIIASGQAPGLSAGEVGCGGSLLRPQALPPRVYGTTSIHAVQDRPELRAVPARQEVHLHFHGVTAEDASAILGRMSQDLASTPTPRGCRS